jgi:hypothetical protein
MTSLTFQVICLFQKVLSNLKSSVAIPGPVFALILGNGSELYDTAEKYGLKLCKGWIAKVGLISGLDPSPSRRYRCVDYV